MTRSPIIPSEGWGVLHLFLRLRTEHPGPEAGSLLAETLTGWAGKIQLHCFSVLGHKADVMLVAIDEDLNLLRDLQRDVTTGQLGHALELAWSYVSLTESSEYTPTREREEERLRASGLEGERLEEMLVKFDERIAAHLDNRLHPVMPEWEVACFYPMSHKREGQDNWYSLPFEERFRLMGEHGKSGRAFAGRVVQLVSGSTGLDDWEWGVTLFAHDIADLKHIVYTLRYDEASARYAEFGPFITGLRRAPEDVAADIGML
jgi:chlorite dismutase